MPAAQPVPEHDRAPDEQDGGEGGKRQSHGVILGRPDVDVAEEWAAHRRAEMWAGVLAGLELLGWGVVALAVLIGVLFAVVGVAR